MTIRHTLIIMASLLMAGMVGARGGLMAVTDDKGAAVDDMIYGVTGSNDTIESADADSADYRRYLPGEVRDTATLGNGMKGTHDYSSKIMMLARSYGDSIVLRWAAEDYVSWQYLNHVGVDVLRMYHDPMGYHVDTLAHALKPASLEELRAAYPESDSLASMAMGMLYGEGKMRQDQSRYGVGTLGALLDVHGDQQMTFGFAVLLSEWRMDLADRMAMRFVDRDVKVGRTYEYNILPAVPDASGHLMFKSGYANMNVSYAEFGKGGKILREKFETEIGDSLVAPNSIRLWWSNSKYSSYEIERREAGTQQWTRVNDKPYIMFMEGNRGEDAFISDNVPHPGDWEYRIFGHDAFGDLTQPSEIYTAHIRDIEAPRAPEITLINITRRDTADLSKDVYADIYIRKDTMEQDIAGYVPMYYHAKVNNGQWMKLTDSMMSPTDTLCTVNVTGLPTGQLTIAAYDKSNNVSYAIPRIMRIADMQPPHAPQGLRYVSRIENVETGNPVGLIELRWDAIENDDIDYYEIVVANDTTHSFMTQKNGTVKENCFVDTVALDVNQKYIYYKVRGVDYSTNMGRYSDVIQVIRPSLLPPVVAHLDSSYVDAKGVYMRWIAGGDAQAEYHKIYRRLVDMDKNKKWTLIAVCDADSVRMAGGVMNVFDHPKENSYDEYAYAVESFNYSGISSGLSLQYVTRFTGDPVFALPIRLVGDYDEDSRKTKLAWDVDNAPKGNDWYFCIWRKVPDDERFTFLLSADSDERMFTDRLLRAGETAQYFIQVQMEDGRESEPSNVVTVKAPAKK